ncbi:aminoglycoside phosphotransferase [Streptomyces sp. HNM0663]|uniref:Aminoglycoside phosphotransferase n=1 Tax=Streptomyces chengmaiensis TaxID=3040919 RepID=A0ABT6HGE6_9ACTN|nr:aminoglycoside phosphotransferase [Streptomyces chengmaiensis]MDH2387650.1 aminoglycoside phosphotransferase [Streptomyces chengmaiensis]
MPVDRIHWDDLPLAARAAVEHHTGPVLHAATADAGANSGIAAIITTADETLFVKGVPTDHPQIRTQQREAAINPYLPPPCPRLLWHVNVAGWDLIGYEHLVARHADYAPGSPDLPLVARALLELQSTRCPDIGLKRAEDRWSGYAGPAGVEQLAGDTLLHTDLAPHNVLMTDIAHLIDWAWPTRGAAWIDPAVLILRLMEAGHTAEDADAWARGEFPSWAAAEHDAVAAFSEANAHTWDEIARHDPQDWKKHMGRLAHDWVTYWRTQAP